MATLQATTPTNVILLGEHGVNCGSTTNDAASDVFVHVLRGEEPLFRVA